MRFECFELHGRLNIESLPVFFEKGSMLLGDGDMCVDFSRVESVDSSVISMLLAWKRIAQRTRHDLSVVGYPEDLLSLARLYGVEEILPAPRAAS